MMIRMIPLCATGSIIGDSISTITQTASKTVPRAFMRSPFACRIRKLDPFESQQHFPPVKAKLGIAALVRAAAAPPSSVMNSGLQNGAENAMSIRIGYLLPPRERITAGQPQAASLLELAERAE